MDKLNQIRNELVQLYKQRRLLTEQFNQEQQDANQINSETDLGQSETNNISKSAERGKSLTLSNGHSILGDNNKISGGFINMIIMALLAGFASGVVVTAIYIFMNLGKVTVSL